MSSPGLVHTVADEQAGTAERAVLVRCHPDEPVFVLLGHDLFAARTVRYWAFLAAEAGVDAARVAQAQIQSEAMEAWPEGRLPGLRAGRSNLEIGARVQREYPDSHLNRAHANCPIFVLRARDELADRVVEFWAWAAATHGAPDPSRARQALRIARSMRLWQGRRTPGLMPSGDSAEDGIGEVTVPQAAGAPISETTPSSGPVLDVVEPAMDHPPEDGGIDLPIDLAGVPLEDFAGFDNEAGCLARALLLVARETAGRAEVSPAVLAQARERCLMGQDRTIEAYAGLNNDIGRMARVWLGYQEGRQS